MIATARSLPLRRYVPSSFLDPVRAAVWGAALILALVALGVHPGALRAAAAATAGPFATLALVIAAGAAADAVGAFGAAARAITAGARGPLAASAALLAFTAVVSGLVNLDVAVVVAVPLVARVAARTGARADRLAVAVALTANSTSLLLPTSNLTTLLVLSRSPLTPAAFAARAWPAWLAVTALTVTVLALTTGSGGGVTAGGAVERPRWGGVLLDLVALFAAASAIRALVTAGVTLGGGVVATAGLGSALAAALNNLPAAAAVHVTSTAAAWAASYAMALGPDAVLTGSVAALVCRELARRRGGGFSALRYSALGTALLPLQLALGLGTLWCTGTLH